MKKNDAAGVEIAKLLGEGLVDIPKKGYKIAKVPVTQALWTAIMGENPSEVKGGDYPVTFVGIDRIVKFITKLNSRKEVKSAGLVFGLPSADEWKYACAGSKRGVAMLSVYDLGWWMENSEKRLHPVAQKPANAFGIFDMAGNVSELCSDGSYRGGSFHTEAFRYGPGFNGVSLWSRGPLFGSYDEGFRLVAHDAGWKWMDELSVECWRSILVADPSFAKSCPCFSDFDGRAWGEVLQEQPSLSAKCNWGKLDGSDWAYLLMKQPKFANHCEWKKLNADYWSRLIAERPEFAERCDKWDEMSALDWRNILIVLPKLADKFSGWAEFDAMDWVCLLEEQPSFAKYCKDFSVFDASDWERLLEAQPRLKKFKP